MKIIKRKAAPNKKRPKADFNPTPEQVKAAARQSMSVLDKVISEDRSIKIHLDKD